MIIPRDGLEVLLRVFITFTLMVAVERSQVTHFKRTRKRTLQDCVHFFSRGNSWR